MRHIVKQGIGLQLLGISNLGQDCILYLYRASLFVPESGTELSLPVSKFRSVTGSSKRCFAVLISLYKLVGVESSIAVICPVMWSVCIQQSLTSHIKACQRFIVTVPTTYWE